MCEQFVVKKSKLTHIAFNIFEPILIIGDDKGAVVSMKLSPNLRRKGQTPEDEPERLIKLINGSKGNTILS